jgi:uncharacterized membrane protein YedE/YeeE
LTERFALPLATTVDARLILGATLFGIGWGLSGLCPGPAITSLPLVAKGTLVFVPAMLVGIALARLAAVPKAPSGRSVPARGV